MARLIVKSPYFKGGGAKPAGGYLRYIATRERVEILPDDRPPTKRQTQFIEKLTKDFPDTKTLLEYGDYTAHPTKFNASQFLTLAMEENWGKVQEIDGYAKYIATRPRAERMGEHGLFGDEDAVDLNAAMAEVNSCTGNIWTHIISLRREDAERLGFDHADAWRALLRAHRNDIAEAMHIPPEDFRWYAAFHDEGGHPHIHMMAWSKKPGQAYLNRDGIRKIKSVLTNQIFQQELLHIYEDKSQSRDELVWETRSAMLALAQKMQNSACEHPEAAVEFMNYFYNDDTALETLGATRSVPPTEKARKICSDKGILSEITMEGADIAAAMGGTPNDKISSSQESKTILFDSVETIGYGASTPEEAAADTINLLSGLEQ